MRKAVLSCLMILGITLIFNHSLLFGQSIDEAGEQFNRGIELTQTQDYEGAIKAYEKCMEICDKLGDEGDDLKIRVFSIIPDLHYQAGLALYRNKKIAESIPRLEKAAAVAREFGDKATEDKANRLIPQLYYAVGSDFYKKNEFETALNNLNKAVEIDPNYSKPYLIIGLTYGKLERVEDMKTALDKAIEMGMTEGDDKTVSTARDAGYRSFLNRGQRSIKANKFQEAEGHLLNAAHYDDSNASIHYLLAVTFNKLAKTDDALVAAQKAVELEEDSDDKRAAAYFELGMAHKAKGEATQACAAFRKATFGPNAEAAKYQIETELKCN